MTGVGASNERRVRRRAAPTRSFADKIVVARPLDGAPVVLTLPAAHLWTLLDDWRTADELDAALAERHPDIDIAERAAARASTLTALDDDDLLDHG